MRFRKVYLQWKGLMIPSMLIGLMFIILVLHLEGWDHGTQIVNGLNQDYNRYNTSKNVHLPQTSHFNVYQPSFSSRRMEHDRISIDGNADFINQAAIEGWNGSGTPSNPIVISGYNIIYSSNILLEIKNTDLYFQVHNNVFDGVVPGTPETSDQSCIYLENVTHGRITNNSFYNRWRTIYLNHSVQNILSSNIISGGIEGGIFLEWSSNNTILSNSFYNNSGGINLYVSSHNIVKNNTLINNDSGILLQWGSNNNIVSNNSITDSIHYDIRLSLSAYNTVVNNTLKETWWGVVLDESPFNSVMNNTINNAGYGMYVQHSSDDNTFFNNIVVNNTKFGIFLDSSINNNLIKWNDFIDNNLVGTSQALDDGSNNTFMYNYWADWNSPDLNADGIIDMPYKISGSASNADPYPLVTPNNPSIIQIPNTSTTVQTTFPTYTYTSPSWTQADWGYGFLRVIFLITFLIVLYIGVGLTVVIYYFIKKD